MSKPKMKFKEGDVVNFNDDGKVIVRKVLGFAASEDEHGNKLVEIAWNDYSISPTGYLAVPQSELEFYNQRTFPMKSKHKFVILFVNKKTKEIDMKMTCKTRLMTIEEAKSLAKREVRQTQKKHKKYIICVDFL